MPMQIASSRPASSAPRSSTPRSSASAWATDGGPANAAAALSSRGSERRTRARSGPGVRPKSRRSGERATRSTAAASYGKPWSAPETRGWWSTSDTPRSGTRPASARSSALAACQPSEPAVSSSDSPPLAAAIVSGPVAARSAPAPPCSTVSAAVTTTTRSVSTTAGWTRAAPTSTSAGSSTSCTATRPWKRRAKSGFTNMLFKLLSDYRPKGVAVAWDTRPVHRTELSEEYKSERRPMPDLLREQFPYFRPIVEAFGYRNLEFEGWEADDVIATLATRADDAGIRTTVVSTDRDAFQLVSGNVALMMTPRGVSDVHVYTPDRVEARYGIRPEQVPDFIGLKGDTSDNIPGVPGIGDKTAGQLIGQYGSLEEVLAHVGELSPARRKNLTEHAEQAQQSKELATMRRDLDVDCDPAQLVLQPPDRSQLREMFRRFEFRGLLSRVDQLDEAVPAMPMRTEGTEVQWREGDFPTVTTRAALAIEDGRFALAAGDGVVVGPWQPELAARVPDGVLIAHDFKALPRLTMQPAEDTMILAYLIEPGRASYELDDLAREYGVEPIPTPATDEETAALVRHAEIPRRLAPMLLERVREREQEHLYREIELPLTAVLAAMEDAGVKIDTYRMGEITARLADRVEELESKAYELAGEDFMIGSTQQVGRVLFEKLELTPGRKGKTGYSTDTRVLRSIRGDHEIVGVLEEWREYSKLLNTYLEPLPSLISET